MERLVQRHGIARPDIFIQSASAKNTAGSSPAGGDVSQADGARNDAPLEGEIEVSRDITMRQEIRTRFMSKLPAPEVSVVHQQESGADRPSGAALNRQIEQLTALRRRTDRQSVRDVAKVIAGGKHRIVIGSGSFASIASVLAHLTKIAPMAGKPFDTL